MEKDYKEKKIPTESHIILEQRDPSIVNIQIRGVWAGWMKLTHTRAHNAHWGILSNRRSAEGDKMIHADMAREKTDAAFSNCIFFSQ